MFSKLRSLIFKIDPERAHTLAIKSLKLNLVSNIFDKNKDDPIFKTKIFDKEIDNPIGMAAGFDKNAEVYNALFRLGFGFVEVGTITPLKQYGNPKPRVFRLVEDEALINRLGFNNHGAEVILDRIKSNNQLGLLGINIGPNKDSNNRMNDYLIGLKTFHEVADYIAINISSPNTENLRNFHEESKLQELLASILKEKNNLKSKVPIAVKISSDIDESLINLISEILLENETKAIIISNTSESSRGGLSDIQRHQKGGLSGKPIEIKSNILINKFYKHLQNKIKIQSIKKDITKNIRKINNVNFFVGEIDLDPKSIKELCFTISDQIDNLFMILLSKSTDKVFMSCFLSKNIISEKELDASNVIKELSPLINGSGGGQSFYATGGGTNVDGIDSVISEAEKIISQI